MFGNAFFGKTYYGDPYFGPGAAAPTPPVVTSPVFGRRFGKVQFRPNVRPVEESEPVAIAEVRNDDAEVEEIVHAFMAARRLH